MPMPLQRAISLPSLQLAAGSGFNVARSRSKQQLGHALKAKDENARARRIAQALAPYCIAGSNPGVLGQIGVDAARTLRETKDRQSSAAFAYPAEASQESAKVALFQKGRKTLLAGLKDGSLERIVSEMEKQKAMIAAELDAFEKMDLKVVDFIKEFRTNEKLLQKVSLSTGLAMSDLSSLQDAELIKWFEDMDTDCSGTLSFDEFVEGIMKVREEQMASDQRTAKVALFQKGRKTLLAGLKDGSLEKVVGEMEKQKALIAAELDAFEKMDLKVEDFIKEFRNNEKLVQKVSLSTGLATSDLSGLQDADLIRWFQDMDTDGSGTLSFDEFVEGIMKVREEQMAADKRTAKVAIFQKGRKSLLAGLKDGSLERVVDQMEAKQDSQ